MKLKETQEVRIPISEGQAHKEYLEYKAYYATFERYPWDEPRMAMPRTFEEYFGHTLWVNEDGSCYMVEVS